MSQIEGDNHSLLFIPDISGFTAFVNQTEIQHGQHIISELLELIIDADQLGLTVSEIEGDAILFYKKGEVPSAEELVAQSRHMFIKFHSHLRSFEKRRICDCGACSTAHKLSLKIVSHCGPIQFLNIKQFHKPFGPEVILVHRLLKNEIEGGEYFLITDTLFKARSAQFLEMSPSWAQFTKGVSQYDDIGKVPYRFITLGHFHQDVPEPKQLPNFSRIKKPVFIEGHIDRPMKEVFNIILDFQYRLLWNQGVDDLRYNKNEINHIGAVHHCVVNNELVEFETITSDFGNGRRVYGERIQQPPLVKELAVFHILSENGSGTHIRIEAHFHPKRFPGNLAIPFVRMGLNTNVKKLLNGLKQVAEERLDQLANGVKI